jgi:hypothetical protein
LATARCQAVASLGITRGFPRLCPTLGLVTFALLTLPPLALRPVRLACLIHAANVHSEPGSNPSRLERCRGTIQPSSLRILANTNWSPRNRVRGEINPLPHAPRQHEPSDPRPEISRFPPRKPSNRIHAGFPQGIAQKLRVCRRSTGLSKRPPRDRFHPRRDRPEPPALNRAKPRPNGPDQRSRRQNDPGGSSCTSVPSRPTSLVTHPLSFTAASSPATRVMIAGNRPRSTGWSRKLPESSRPISMDRGQLCVFR